MRKERENVRKRALFFKRSFESLFGKIESVEFKGTKILFKPDEETSRDLVASFHYILNE